MNQIQIIKKDVEERISPYMATLASSSITKEKFIATVGLALSKNPKLVKMDRYKVLAAILECANLGLLPDNKEAAIIGYGDSIEMQPMIGGFIKSILSSKTVTSLEVGEVYKDELDSLIDGTDSEAVGRVLKFNRSHKEHTQEDIAIFYVIIRKNDGSSPTIETMSKSEVDGIRKNSAKQPNSPAWRNFYSMMGRKAVIKRASRYLGNYSDDFAKFNEMVEKDNEQFTDYSEQESVKVVEEEKEVVAPKDTFKSTDNTGFCEKKTAVVNRNNESEFYDEKPVAANNNESEFYDEKPPVVVNHNNKKQLHDEKPAAVLDNSEDFLND